MYPHERSLVARLKDRPFALIGVNSDTDKVNLKKRLTAERITWRSFWNGADGTQGPISRAWNVRNWPTLYVLDAKGVIRYKDVTVEELNKAADTLLKELAEQGK
jgi:hypothetical protein